MNIVNEVMSHHAVALQGQMQFVSPPSGKTTHIEADEKSFRSWTHHNLDGSGDVTKVHYWYVWIIVTERSRIRCVCKVCSCCGMQSL